MEKERKICNAIISRYQEYIDGPEELVFKAHEGLPASSFFEVALLYGDQKLIAEYINLSVPTLRHYEKENKKLSPAASELLLKLIQLFAHGIKLFGDPQSFRYWLGKPMLFIHGYTPLELMKTSEGVTLVIDEVVRIEYGDLA